MGTKQILGERPQLSELPYSAGAVSRPFCFLEFQKVISLLNQGVGFDEIERQSIKENLFGLSREYRAREIFRVVRRRAAALDEELITLFSQLDLNGRRLIALLTVIWTDRLFFEFLYEVYQEKLLLGEPEWTNIDFKRFITSKQLQVPSIAGWSESTLKKLPSDYAKKMEGGGLIQIESKKRKITRILIDSRIENYLRRHSMLNILTALTGVRQ